LHQFFQFLLEVRGGGADQREPVALLALLLEGECLREGIMVIEKHEFSLLGVNALLPEHLAVQVQHQKGVLAAVEGQVEAGLVGADCLANDGEGRIKLVYNHFIITVLTD
jgi:hypothetical protein